MRQLLIIFVLLTTPYLTLADELKAGFNLNCTTSVASVSIWTENDKVHFRLEDQEGFNNFPLYSGTVTPAMLPLIQRGASDLTVFNGELEAVWPRKNCQTDASRPFLAKCTGGGEILSPEKTSLSIASLGTSIEKVSSLDVDAEMLNIFVGLDTTGESYAHYFINFPFTQNHCSVSLTAK